MKTDNTIPSSATRRSSAVLAACCLLLALLLPALTLYGLALKPAQAWLPGLGPGAVPIHGWQTTLAMALGLLPVTAMAYGLIRAFLCFRGFLAGRVFSAQTVGHLRGFAAGVIAAALAELAVKPLLSVLLTWNAGSGQRRLTLDIGSQPLLFLLFGAIVWQFADAMRRAVELAEDNAQIV